MEESKEHVCTCGGACKEKFVKVEKKNNDTETQFFWVSLRIFEAYRQARNCINY